MLRFLKREPDLVISHDGVVYLRRWHLIPKNPIFNIYLHNFLHSDDARALHDHPGLFNASILLKGVYTEYLPNDKWKFRKAGSVYFRWGKAAHRIGLWRDFSNCPDSSNESLAAAPAKPVWTLFITGPKVRHWGFYCPQGWRHWKIFTSNEGKNSGIGRGCE